MVRAVNQTIAWISAVVISGAAFAAGYGLFIAFGPSDHQEHKDHPNAEAASHGGEDSKTNEHGETAGGHGSEKGAEHGAQAPADAAHAPPGHQGEPAVQDKGDHGKKAEPGHGQHDENEEEISADQFKTKAEHH